MSDANQDLSKLRDDRQAALVEAERVAKYAKDDLALLDGLLKVGKTVQDAFDKVQTPKPTLMQRLAAAPGLAAAVEAASKECHKEIEAIRTGINDLEEALRVATGAREEQDCKVKKFQADLAARSKAVEELSAQAGEASKQMDAAHKSYETALKQGGDLKKAAADLRDKQGGVDLLVSGQEFKKRWKALAQQHGELQRELDAQRQLVVAEEGAKAALAAAQQRVSDGEKDIMRCVLGRLDREDGGGGGGGGGGSGSHGGGDGGRRR